MSETRDVVRPTLEILNGIPGVIAYRIQSGKVRVRGGWMHLAEPGTPDIGCMVRGLSVFFEAKAPRGVLSDEQLRWHERARRAGAIVVVIRKPSTALDEVRKILDMTTSLVASDPLRTESTVSTLPRRGPPNKSARAGIAVPTRADSTNLEKERGGVD